MNIPKVFAMAGVLLVALWLSACDRSPEPVTPVQLAQGKKIFQANCARCHGKQAEGTPDWRERGADGKLPPPPLNGTAHAWHHPTDMLTEVIKNGSPGGMGSMPAFGKKLSDDEIHLIIEWFKSLWPKEVYDIWLEREKKSR